MNPNTFPADDPHSVPRCEAALVGCVLLDPTQFARVGPVVNDADFNDHHLGELFAAVQLLHEAGKPVKGTVYLVAELKRMKVPEDVRSAHAIAKLINAVVNVAHAVYYAEQVSNAATLRRYASVGAELRSKANAIDADPAALRDWLEAKLAAFDRTKHHEARLVGEVAAEVIAAVDAAAVAETKAGAFTGLHDLDSVLGPMMPGELIIVAARPGQGKTAFGTQVAQHAGERGRRALIVSLEMTDTELTRRILCQWAGLDSRDVRAGRVSESDRKKLHAAGDSLYGLQVRLWAPASANLAKIRGASRYVHATSGLDLLVVDYIGYVRPTAAEQKLQRYEQVSLVSGGLKTLAKELNIPVVALCQLNREADGSEPRLSHLRESGGIEQDADMVLFLHHPEQKPSDFPTQGGRECSLIIGKHRHGESGRVKLLWYPSETRSHRLEGFDS